MLKRFRFGSQDSITNPNPNIIRLAKITNPNPNIRDSEKKIRIRIRIQIFVTTLSPRYTGVPGVGAAVWPGPGQPPVRGRRQAEACLSVVIRNQRDFTKMMMEVCTVYWCRDE